MGNVTLIFKKHLLRNIVFVHSGYSHTDSVLSRKLDIAVALILSHEAIGPPPSLLFKRVGGPANHFLKWFWHEYWDVGDSFALRCGDSMSPTFGSAMRLGGMRSCKATGRFCSGKP